MKLVYVVLFLFAGLTCGDALAADPAPGQPPSPEAQKLAKQCNLEARNSLIHEDMALVEKTCMEAVTEMEKSHADKKYMINPIMNLAYAYTLAGRFEKADPLYSRARHIGEEVYEPDSRQLKEIVRVIEVQEAIKGQQKK